MRKVLRFAVDNQRPLTDRWRGESAVKNRRRRAFASLLLTLGACDPMVSYVVTRQTLVGVDCPDATRDYVMTRKLSCCPDRAPQVTKGRITLGTDDYEREIFGDRKTHFAQSSEYIDVFGGALGSGEVWARLQLTCPSTGAVVYDSGEVLRDHAFCKQDKRYLFLFEGHGDLQCPR